MQYQDIWQHAFVSSGQPLLGRYSIEQLESDMPWLVNVMYSVEPAGIGPKGERELKVTWEADPDICHFKFAWRNSFGPDFSTLDILFPRIGEYKGVKIYTPTDKMNRLWAISWDHDCHRQTLMRQTLQYDWE